MLNTSARLLRLLALLQVKPDWTGPELAARLEVSTRTVRSDVDRLRSLGYPVDAVSGVGGGYRLGAGAALPPLLLDDDEALAVAVGLRTAAGGVAGFEESAARALAKLEQVLPSRLRHRLATLQAATASLPGPAGRRGPGRGAHGHRCGDPGPGAAALRLREPERSGRSADRGAPSAGARPRSLVPRGLGAAAGRLADVPGGPDDPAYAERTALRASPGAGRRPGRLRRAGDRDGPLAGAGPGRGLRSGGRDHRPGAVGGAGRGDRRRDTARRTSARTPRTDLAMWLGMLGADFVVDGPPEMAAAFATMSRRYARAAEAL